MKYAFRGWNKYETPESLELVKTTFERMKVADLLKDIDSFNIGLTYVSIHCIEDDGEQLAPVAGLRRQINPRTLQIEIGGQLFLFPISMIFNPRTVTAGAKYGERVEFDAPVWLLKDRGIIHE